MKKLTSLVAATSLLLPPLPASGLDVKISCKAGDYPQIKCESTYTPMLPKWVVSVGDDVRDIEQGSVVHLVIPDDQFATVTVYHGKVDLDTLKARWVNRRIEFLNEDQ